MRILRVLAVLLALGTGILGLGYLVDPGSTPGGAYSSFVATIGLEAPATALISVPPAPEGATQSAEGTGDSSEPAEGEQHVDRCPRTDAWPSLKGDAFEQIDGAYQEHFTPEMIDALDSAQAEWDAAVDHHQELIAKGVPQEEIDAQIGVVHDLADTIASIQQALHKAREEALAKLVELLREHCYGHVFENMDGSAPVYDRDLESDGRASMAPPFTDEQGDRRTHLPQEGSRVEIGPTAFGDYIEELDVSKLITTLLHEMVHVQQFADQELDNNNADEMEAWGKELVEICNTCVAGNLHELTKIQKQTYDYLTKGAGTPAEVFWSNAQGFERAAAENPECRNLLERVRQMLDEVAQLHDQFVAAQAILACPETPLPLDFFPGLAARTRDLQLLVDELLRKCQPEEEPDEEEPIFEVGGIHGDGSPTAIATDLAGTMRSVGSMMTGDAVGTMWASSGSSSMIFSTVYAQSFGPLKLVISLPATQFRSGEPIPLVVSLTNMSSRTLTVNARIGIGHPGAPRTTRELFLDIYPLIGPKLPLLWRIRTTLRGLEDFIRLAPGESVEKAVDLEEWYGVAAPGLYRVVATYENQMTGPMVFDEDNGNWVQQDIGAVQTVLVSNSLFFMVLRP